MRPCLILSISFLDHERAVITYVPRTTSVRNTRFEVAHQMRGLDPGAFDAQGIGNPVESFFLRHKKLSFWGKLIYY